MEANRQAALVTWPAGRMIDTPLPGWAGLAFSPDGWLWSADRSLSAQVPIEGVPPSGTGAPQSWGPLTPDDSGALLAGSSEAPAISPDGHTAAYLRLDGSLSFSDALYEQPRGGPQREVLRGPEPNMGGEVAFSPDGRLLAVNWDLQLYGELWLVGAGGGPPRIVPLHTAGRPVWSPDGNTVAIDLEGGGVAPVGRDGTVRRPAWLRRAEAPSWTTAQPVPPPAGVLRSSGACAAVRVIGVRGSGEDPHTRRAMGELPYALAVALARSLRRAAVTGEGLGYPAVGIVPGSSNFDPVAYGDSVRLGERALVVLMRRRHHACPRESWVLAAYSQGAEVLGDVLAMHPSGSGQVVAVVGGQTPSTRPTRRPIAAARRGGAS